MSKIVSVRNENEQSKINELHDAQLDAVVQLKDQRKGLAEFARNAHGFAEEMSKRLLHPESPKVACDVSCAWCCYQQVKVSLPEVMLIAEYVRASMDDECKKALLKRLKELHLITQGLSVKKRAGISKSCAFLVDDRCSIYEVRSIS